MIEFLKRPVGILSLTSGLLLAVWVGFQLPRNLENVYFLHVYGASDGQKETLANALDASDRFDLLAQLAESSNLEEASGLYEKAWEQEQSPILAMKWGLVLWELEHYDELRVLWTQNEVLPHIGDKLCADVELARLEQRSDQLEVTVNQLEVISNVNPEADACLTIGYLYQGRLTEAAVRLGSNCCQALDQGRTADLFRKASEAYRDQSDLLSAQAYVLIAIEAQPTDISLRILAASIALQLEEPGSAISQLEAGLAVAPRQYDLNRLMGAAYERQNDLETALSYYLIAFHIRPTNEESHLNLGRVYTDLGQLAEAEVRYREAVTRFPESWMSQILLARNLASQGKLNEAIALYESLLLHESADVAASAQLELESISR